MSFPPKVGETVPVTLHIYWSIKYQVASVWTYKIDYTGYVPLALDVELQFPVTLDAMSLIMESIEEARREARTKFAETVRELDALASQYLAIELYPSK